MAAQQRQCVFLRQLVHRDEGLGLGGAGEIARGQPRGGDQVQAAVARQTIEVFGFENIRVADVVQNEQAALALIQFAQDALEGERELLFSSSVNSNLSGPASWSNATRRSPMCSQRICQRPPG